MIKGLGVAASSIHKDLYKIIKAHTTDRVMTVRVAALNVSKLSLAAYFEDSKQIGRSKLV